MSIIKKAVSGLFGGVLGVGASLLGLNKAKQIKALPAPTRDDAAEAVEADDELRRRQGAAADMVTGTRGASAGSSAGKMILGS